MENYDGWTIKVFLTGKPYLVIGFFQLTRSEVIKDFEKTMNEKWRNWRQAGTHKIVKVKLIEVT